MPPFNLQKKKKKKLRPVLTLRITLTDCLSKISNLNFTVHPISTIVCLEKHYPYLPMHLYYITFLEG